MRLSSWVAVAAALSLTSPAGAGTPMWAETYAAMPGTMTVVDSEASGTVVAVVGGDKVVASKDSGVTWTPLSPLASPPNGGSSQTKVSPSTPATWFAENGGAVSKTVDGGASWRLLKVPPVVRVARESFEFSTEIAAVDAAPVAAVGWTGARVVEGCPYSFAFTPVFVTHDGGARWRRSDLPASGEVNSIDWLDRRQAALVLLEFDWPEPTHDGAWCGATADLARSSVWTTTDGGASWRRAYVSAGPAWVAAAWSSARTLAVVEEREGGARTFVSNDGGRTFSRPQALFDNKGVNGFVSMQFATGRRGWIGSIVAGIFRSDTGGAEWVHEVSPADGSIYGVPEITAIDRDSAVHGGPRSLVTRLGEAPVAGPAVAPWTGAPPLTTVTTTIGNVMSMLTLPVRGLPSRTWRVASGA